MPDVFPARGTTHQHQPETPARVKMVRVWPGVQDIIVVGCDRQGLYARLHTTL